MAQKNGQNSSANAPAIIGARDGSEAPKDIKALLNSPTTAKRLKAIAASHMNPDRLMRISALAIHNTPNLVKCRPMSLLGVIFKCGELGMEPNTPLQHCHLVPYKKKKRTPDGNFVEEYDVELIIGYRGYIDLARRSGLTATIHADVVFQADEFAYSYGTDQFLKHKPRLTDLDAEGRMVLVENRGDSIGYYAYCKLEGGEAFKVMSKGDVTRIRDESQGYQSALYLKNEAEKKRWKSLPKAWTTCPWVKHFDAMGRKSPIRALASELPLSVEFSKASGIDGREIDYERMANASDGEIVDLDPSHWQYEDDDEDNGPEVDGDPAGDNGPAKIQQSAEPTMQPVDQSEPEPVRQDQPKAAAARRSKPADGGSLFPAGG